MQHGDASDYMTGSAKQAVDTAMRDARSQVVGRAAPEGRPEAAPTPERADPALTLADPAPGASA